MKLNVTKTLAKIAIASTSLGAHVLIFKIVFGLDLSWSLMAGIISWAINAYNSDIFNDNKN